MFLLLSLHYLLDVSISTLSSRLFSSDNVTFLCYCYYIIPWTLADLYMILCIVSAILSLPYLFCYSSELSTHYLLDVSISTCLRYCDIISTLLFLSLGYPRCLDVYMLLSIHYLLNVSISTLSSSRCLSYFLYFITNIAISALFSLLSLRTTLSL